MFHPLPRRQCVLGTCAAAALASAPSLGSTTEPIAELERRHGGRLGVFAIDCGNGRTLAHRADERFLMQSTFKGVLAGMVLARIDQGKDTLDAAVALAGADILPSSPVTAAHLAQGRMSVGALCQAILEESDNAAANLLLARVGGPAWLTEFARSLGDTVTRFDRYELIGGWSGTKDTTTPRAMTGLVRTLILGNALTPASRKMLRDWMAACAPGRMRLRAGFPATWRAADRTGTGDGICNDYAVAWRPVGRPLVMAAYYEANGMEHAAQEAVLRDAGAAIAAWSK